MLESNPPRDSRSGYRRNVERGEGARSTLPTPLKPFRRFPPSLKKLKAKSCLESNPSCRIHAEPRHIDAYRLGLKQKRCPFCWLVGWLIGHGYLRGCGPRGEGGAVRGGRVFCSNRHRRGGCGRTFPVMLSWVLRGSPVSAGRVWRFLRNVARGQSRAAAWRCSGAHFTVSAGYRVWKRWLRNQTRLRSLLRDWSGAEPRNAQGDPPAATLAHLTVVFTSGDCPIRAFQEHFQQPFLR